LNITDTNMGAKKKYLGLYIHLFILEIHNME
jgi:hypothetical protein